MSILTLDETKFRTAGDVLEVVRRFEDCTLPREEWTHAAQLIVGLWYILQYDWPTAVERVRRGILRYNEAHGTRPPPEGGYHETLTLFWLRRVRAFLEEGRNEARSLASLASELSETADRRLPFEYYTRERLFSAEARAGWVEPDLKPLT